MRIGLAGLVAAVVLGLATGIASAQDGSLTYNVTIENLTEGQPFTPPVILTHTDGIEVFEVGETASDELKEIAENGNNDPLVTLAGGSADVLDSTVGDAPIMPGGSATFSVGAPANSHLSAVFMLICTNDGFSGVDSLALPASGSTSVDASAYDAGTEQNTEDFADMVPPCQELVGVSSDDEGTGMSDPALAEGGVVAMHPGITGGTDLTVTDHGWTDPVARITVSVEETALPVAGTALPTSNGVSMGLIVLGVLGAALVVLGGGIGLMRRRTAR